MQVRQLYNYIFGDYADIDNYIDNRIANTTKNIKSEEDLTKAIARLEDERKQRYIDLRNFFRPAARFCDEFPYVLRTLKAPKVIEYELYGKQKNIDDKLQEFSSYSAIPDAYPISDEKIYILCKLIADFFEQNNDQDNSVAGRHAFIIELIFGADSTRKTIDNFIHYLDTHNLSLAAKPVHDALIYPTLANKDLYKIRYEDYLPFWQTLIKQKGPQAARLFDMAGKIQDKLGRTPRDFNEVMQTAKLLTYKQADQYSELADLCMQYHLSEEIFEQCLEIEKQRKTKDNLPDISINGQDLGHPGYYLVKLPIDDPRAYILGHITDCCQSIGGDSEECVIDGITRENNGFYVLLKANKNNKSFPPFLTNGKIDHQHFSIIGQGYAWLSDVNNLVFDSWENRRKEDDVTLIPMLTSFAKEATKNSNIIKVTIGQGGKTPDYFQDADKVPCAEKMLEGTEYGDANRQSAIFTNEERISEFRKELTSIITAQTNSIPLTFSQYFVSSLYLESVPDYRLSKMLLGLKTVQTLFKLNLNEKISLDLSNDEPLHLFSFLLKTMNAEAKIQLIKEMNLPTDQMSALIYKYHLIGFILPDLIEQGEINLAKSLFTPQDIKSKFKHSNLFYLFAKVPRKTIDFLISDILGTEYIKLIIGNGISLGLAHSYLNENNNWAWFIERIYTQNEFQKFLASANIDEYSLSRLLPSSNQISFLTNWIGKDILLKNSQKNPFQFLRVLHDIGNPIELSFLFVAQDYYKQNIQNESQLSDFIFDIENLHKNQDQFNSIIEQTIGLEHLRAVLPELDSIWKITFRLPKEIRPFFLKDMLGSKHLQHSIAKTWYLERARYFALLLNELDSTELATFLQEVINKKSLLFLLIKNNYWRTISLNFNALKEVLKAEKFKILTEDILGIPPEELDDNSSKLTFKLAMEFLKETADAELQNGPHRILGEAGNDFHAKMLHASQTNPCTDKDFENMASIAYDIACQIDKPDTYKHSGTLRDFPIPFGQPKLGRIIAGALCAFLGAALVAASITVALASFGVIAPISIAAMTLGVNMMIGGIAAATAVTTAGLTTGACFFAASGRKQDLALETDKLFNYIPSYAATLHSPSS